jgi:hypothetical protein
MDMVAWPGRDAGSEGGNAWRWNMESASAVRLVAEDVSSFGTCTLRDLFTPFRSTTDSKERDKTTSSILFSSSWTMPILSHHNIISLQL